MKLTNIILPDRKTSERFTVEIVDNQIQSIEAYSSNTGTDSASSLLVPSLCHPHIHLDKPFLLTCHNDDPNLPDYSDLAPESGEFKEALAKTGAAKERYNHADLIRRGSQLIAESIQAGVSCMRAFVEIDHVTKFKCIEAGIELKQKFSKMCHVQICAFAQDPIYSTEHGEKNRQLMEEALIKYKGDIEVVGSTPYVEENVEKQQKNIDWTFDEALQGNLNLDFHLDYNLDEKAQPMIWEVIEAMKNRGWTKAKTKRTVVIGHCTRLCHFSQEEMERLSKTILDNDLPVSFVGLPTSDLFMMGRPDSSSHWGGNRPRGTKQVLELIKRFRLNAAMGINNVGNAFTPWGNLDPLRLASLGVGLYHAGTPRDAELLFECISSRAKQAIGVEDENAVTISSMTSKAKGPFLRIKNHMSINLVAEKIPARQRISIADIVWDPPEIGQRELLM